MHTYPVDLGGLFCFMLTYSSSCAKGMRSCRRGRDKQTYRWQICRQCCSNATSYYRTVGGHVRHIPTPWGTPHLKQDEKNVMWEIKTLMGSLQRQRQVVTGLTFIDCVSLLFCFRTEIHGLNCRGCSAN